MKKLLTIAVIVLSMSATAQTITDKNGYSIDVTDYEMIEVTKSTNPIQGVKLLGDGYDEIIIKKGSKIQDGDREITDKTKEFAKKNAFWKSFMKRNGFSFLDAVSATKKNTNAVSSYLPGANAKETVLTFVKTEL